MPHVTFVALSGFRVREAEMAELGMQLPGLRPRAEAIAGLPALGLLTLAGATPDDWSVSYHEAPAVDDDLVQTIDTEAPTLVAISALTASILEAYDLCARLRALGRRTVLGGLHVTACPDEAMRHADAVVVGDGEPVWPDVLTDAAADTLAPCYRAERPFDLADAPLPRYDLLGTVDRPRYTLQTARGCPLACDFCAASRLLGPFREKPVERVRAELETLRRLDPAPLLELADDNTFVGRRDPAPLLEALRDSGARWFTEVDWRIGERPDVLAGLAGAGCVQVLIGLESLVHDHPGMGAKLDQRSRMLEAIAAIQDAGVAVIGCGIVGSDGETRASIDRLATVLETDPCADVQLTLLTPFPGTALRRRLAAAGRLRPVRDWSSCTLFDVAHIPDAMTPDELQDAFNGLVQRVFGPEETRRRQRIRRAIWTRNGRLHA